MSFISAVRMLRRVHEVLADGYKKVRVPTLRLVHTFTSECLPQYPIFKIPTIDHWVVIVSGKYMEELHRAPDDVLSFMEAVREVSASFFQVTRSFIVPVNQN